MAYMNQQKKAVIKQALDPVLKKHGLKGSLKVRNGMTICLTLKAGKIDFRQYIADPRVRETFPQKDYCMTVNPYHIHAQWENPVSNVLTEIVDAMKSAGWYDRSDSMVDYFDTAYYYDISIGAWNKPYLVTG